MTRYREAFSWPRSIPELLDVIVTERPVLHVCSGRSGWGDVTLDLYEPADVNADWMQLPFPDNAFESVFADPPWDAPYKAETAAFMREALRVAPVAYLMAPWLYGAAWADLTRVWYRQMPGVHAPILISRYERTRQLVLLAVSQPGERAAPSEPEGPNPAQAATVGESGSLDAGAEA